MKKFWGFSKLMKLLWNFWVGFYKNALISSCIASHVHYHYIFMHLVVLYMLNCLCAGRFGLGWAHDDITIARHMLMHFHAYVIYIQYIFVYLYCFGTFLSVSFFPPPPPHSLVYVNASWQQNVSLLRLETFFVSGHLHLLILPPFLFGFVMRMPERTSRRTFLD